MADKKITDLTALAAVSVDAATDVLPIVDVSATETKKITVASLKTAVAPDLSTYATLASPTFTGTVVLPSGTSVGNVSSTELGYVDGVTSAIQTQIDLKAPLASPTFTGTPTLPTGTVATTQTALDSSTKLATTAFVTTADNLKANLASPTLTGTPLAPTATAGTSTTQIATTAFADPQGDQYVLAGALFT